MAASTVKPWPDRSSVINEGSTLPARQLSVNAAASEVQQRSDRELADLGESQAWSITSRLWTREQLQANLDHIVSRTDVFVG